MLKPISEIACSQNRTVLVNMYNTNANILKPFSEDFNQLLCLCDLEAITYKRFFLFRVLRKLHVIKDMPLNLKMFTGNWKNHISEFDNWIFFYDYVNFEKVIKVIKKGNPNARFFFYSWDIDYKFNDLERLKKIGACGSFDKKFVDDFGVKYWGQFYNTKGIGTFLEKKESITSDYLFLGQDKGRKQILDSIGSALTNAGLAGEIVITSKALQVPYQDYLRMVKKTKCLIDIVQDNQTGLTYRVMEALFFDKKLITNNKFIKNCDFYMPQNVYVLGDENRDFKTFFETPSKTVPESIKQNYTLKSFINRVTAEPSESATGE